MRNERNNCDTGGMRSVDTLRRLHASTWETAILPCPDGIYRLVLLQQATWQQLNTLYASCPHKADDDMLREILDHVLPICQQAVEYEGWEHETAFRETLHYCIESNYQSYCQHRDNLANDNYDLPNFC